MTLSTSTPVDRSTHIVLVVCSVIGRIVVVRACDVGDVAVEFGV